MFASLPEAFTEYRVPFPERPEEISALRKEPDEMSLRETLAYAHDLATSRVVDPMYLVAFHGKVAYAACASLWQASDAAGLHMNRNGGLTLALSLTLLCWFYLCDPAQFFACLGRMAFTPRRSRLGCEWFVWQRGVVSGRTSAVSMVALQRLPNGGRKGVTDVAEEIAQRALRLKAELQRLRSLLAEQPTVQQSSSLARPPLVRRMNGVILM